MKTRPIRPGALADVADLAEAGGAAKALLHAQRLVCGGDGATPTWRGQQDWVILTLGFGAGTQFLTLWDAWRRDPQRCARLHLVAIEERPLQTADMARVWTAGQLTSGQRELAAQLLQAWPPLTANLHCLDFDQSRVRLTLVFGSAHDLLPTLRLQADQFVVNRDPLDVSGLLPKQLFRTYKALARVAKQGAALALVHRGFRPAFVDAVQAAGFVVPAAEGVEPSEHAAPLVDVIRAHFSPRFSPRPPSSHSPQATVAQRRVAAAPARLPTTALVVGGGIAGAAAAQALASLGATVQVLDRARMPGAGASGNAAGLFHGTVHPQDGRYARLFRAAALFAASQYHAAQKTHNTLDGEIRTSAASRQTPRMGQFEGLLRLETSGQSLVAMQSLLLQQGLPPQYVQALDAASSSELAGLNVQHPAWFYPGGGWLAPKLWIEQALAAPGVNWRGGLQVGRLHRDANDWVLSDPHGLELARAPLLVLAHAEGVMPLLTPLGFSPWPLRTIRGQVTQWSSSHKVELRLPLAGDGYALPLPGTMLCGATRQDGDTEPRLRAADHQENLARFARLTGLTPPVESGHLEGRVAWRLHSDDQLPIAGSVPARHQGVGARMDQCRLLQREPGLFVLTALGSRGITLAPLLARLVAAQAMGTPWPLEQDLIDAVDPGRWQVRAARRATIQDAHRTKEAG